MINLSVPIFVVLLNSDAIMGQNLRIGIILDEEEHWNGPTIQFLNVAMDVLNSNEEHNSAIKLSYGPIFYQNNTFRYAYAKIIGISGNGLLCSIRQT